MNDTLRMIWAAVMVAYNAASAYNNPEWRDRDEDSDEYAMHGTSDADLIGWVDDLEDRVGLDVSDMRAAVATYCTERAGEWDSVKARMAALDDVLSTLSEAGRYPAPSNVYAALSHGAADSYFAENTGGGVWVSYSLFSGGVFVVASFDGFDMYRIPAGITARNASDILWGEGGDVPAGWEIV